VRNGSGEGLEEGAGEAGRPEIGRERERERGEPNLGRWRWCWRSRSAGRPERGRERGKSETGKRVGGEMNFPPTRLTLKKKKKKENKKKKKNSSHVGMSVK
jgi:hypothetical protein